VGRLVVDCASQPDDAELRRLLAANPLGGQILLTLEREPDFFAAGTVEGDRRRTVVAREPSTGRVVGLGTRSVSTVMVNGEPCRMGYLGQLRVDSAYRGRPSLLAAGYDLLRAGRREDEIPFDLTTIIADNQVARRLLESGVPRLPEYRAVEPFVTLVIPVRRQRSMQTSVERASEGRIDEVSRCLERNRRRNQFAPIFSTEDLLSPERSRGLAPSDFLLYRSGGGIAGCLALWDQRSFKQVVVRGFGPRLLRWRPWLDLVSRARGGPRIPRPGETLPLAFISHLAVDGDDDGVFHQLLLAALAEARLRHIDYLVLGLAARHPWLRRLRRAFRAWEYVSIIYTVSWERGRKMPFDGRMPHVEVAML